MGLFAMMKSKRRDLSHRMRMKRSAAMAPYDWKKPTRISVGMTRDEATEFAKLARRCKTSVSALGQLAMQQIMLQAREGAVPMIAPVRPKEMPDESTIELDRAGHLTSVERLVLEVSQLPASYD